MKGYVNGYFSNMAIDVWRVDPGKCNGIPSFSYRPYTTNRKTFSCDFESSGICQMTQNTDDNFDWIRRSGRTPSPGSGPSGDHTARRNGRGKNRFLTIILKSLTII